MKREEDGINLVRCIALFLVMGCHLFLYNGYSFQPQVGGWMLLANSCRYVCLACNGIYMMLTGYLRGHKTVDKKFYACLLPVIISYVIAATISIPVRHFLLGQEESLSTWIYRFFEFSGVYYGWYIRMYIGLILLSPIINLALQKIEDDRDLLFITASCVAVTSFASATPAPIFPSYWEIAYPLSFYLIGATIHRLKPTVKKLPCFIIITIMALGTGLVTLLSTDGELADSYGYGHGVIWIMAIAVCIFLAFYQFEAKGIIKKLLSFGAKGAFIAYMLSNLNDVWMYKLVPEWREPQNYIFLMICFMIPSYIIMICIGNLLQLLTNKIVARITKYH